MTKLAWDQDGERLYETGVDHGVLYLTSGGSAYDKGFAWNGLIGVTESPTGAEVTPFYADNIQYLNLTATEWFGASIEAYTYPDEFGECDGTVSPVAGISFGQQARRRFGMAYRTRIGNDQQGDAYGYKIHLIYGAQVAPSERTYTSVNDSPEPLTFSWEVTTDAVEVEGYRRTASLTIDSTKVDAAALASLEAILYGTDGVEPRLPMPTEVVALFAGTVTVAVPTEPAFDSATNTITIPTVTGVVYSINGEVVTGSVVITEDTLVHAAPASGYEFPAVSDDDWLYTYTP